VSEGGERARQPWAALVLGAVLLLGGALLSVFLLRGWFPHDEGSLGQSAVRVLQGEVPHRDFDEIYTGLLSYIHAGVFAVFGIGTVPLRLPLFVAAMGWLAATYRILLRFAPPVGAGLAALAVFVWSVPNYPASLPSWYILFFATFAALSLMRWHEGGDRRFIALAGALAGIALLFKLSGIFVLLGGGLALLVAEQAPGGLAASAPDSDGSRGGAAAVDSATAPRAARGNYEWALALVLVFVVVALGAVAGRVGDRELFRIAFPTSLVALAILARTWTPPFAPAHERWRALIQRLTPFTVGAVVPLGFFLLFYLVVGGAGQMLGGVFVTPFRRIASASLSPPPPVTILLAVPLAALLWLPSRRGAMRFVAPALAALWFGAIVVLSGTGGQWYRAGWYAAWGLLFILSVDTARMVLATATAGTTARVTTPNATHGAALRSAITLCCLAVGLALVEYPFAAPIYTLYALPLTLVAAVAATRVIGRAGTAVQLIGALFFLAFGLVRIVPGSVGSLGRAFARSPDVAQLELPRGGLRIDAREAEVYDALIPFVVERAAGRPIWAGPDSPEVYFLSGLPNHTRTFFDFLDAPATTARPLVERLEALGAAVVVIKLTSQFSKPIPPETFAELRAAYPHERDFRGFVVLWR